MRSQQSLNHPLVRSVPLFTNLLLESCIIFLGEGKRIGGTGLEMRLVFFDLIYFFSFANLFIKRLTVA